MLRSLAGNQVIGTALNGIPLRPQSLITMLQGEPYWDWIEITLMVLSVLAPVAGRLGIPVNGYWVVNKPALV